MVKIILYAIMVVFTNVPFAYAVNYVLTPKKKSRLNFVYIIAILGVFLIIKLFIDEFYKVSVISMGVNFTAEYLTMKFFTKDSWKTVLKLFFCICLGMVLSEFFCALVFYALGNEIGNSNNVPTAAVRFLSAISVSIFMFLGIFLWQKIQRAVINTNAWQFIILFGLQMFLGSSFVVWLVTKENYEFKIFEVILYPTIAWIIVDIFFIKSVYDNHRKAQLQLSLNQAMEMEKLQYEYYESLTDSINSLRKYRHDMNNLLQTVALIVENPDTQQNGKELLEQLTKRFKDTQIPYYCSNAVINAVIFAKSQAARDKGISADISVNLDNTSSIENIDLCSIFSNMIDNAVEAASEVSNGKIVITAWSDTGYLFIKSVNSYSGKISKRNKKILSTKGKDRGLGLSIMETTAQKYGGGLFIEAAEDFQTLVTMKI